MNFNGVFYDNKDYELTDKFLGKGTYGSVYIAKNLEDSKDYAMKILHSETGFGGNEQMQIMKESMLLHSLNHPAIVKFFGINFQSIKNQSELQPSIITEYLPNKSLKNILRTKDKKVMTNWNSTKKCIALLGISHAMKYLHQNKIIHRDLKPENVLVDENFYPRVCDFGLSRCLPDNFSLSFKLSMTGQLGTPLYMAPEMIEDDHYDRSIDVYAFSLLAYEIVTGKTPFEELGKSINCFKFQQKIISGLRPEFPPNINEKMKELISECWDGNPDDRPSFDTIYSQLSKDLSYFENDINKEEVSKYINQLRKNDEEQYYIQNPKVDNVHENYFRALDSLFGDKKERNINDATGLLKVSSEKGDSYSSYLLGLLYQNGEGLETDFNQSKKYYNLCSKQGNSFGLLRLGLCYDDGLGVEQDSEKAIEYYEKAALQGNSRAFNCIGLCYDDGNGVEQDSKKAVEYYKKSANLGNSFALCNLGLCYKNGEGVDKNFRKAFDFIQRSVDMGNSNAMTNLAILYDRGKGVDKDISKAVELYKRAADLGHSTALNNLAVCYKKGEGVEKNYKMAIQCYQKAASLDDPIAMFNLGLCYEYGDGIQKNMSKAIQYYKKAADLDNADALYNLGRLFESGEGVDKSMKKAVEYYKMAAKFDHKKAVSKLKELGIEI